MSWECITEYILLDVFKYLDPDQIKRAARVCKWWRNVAEDSRLWRLKVQQLFHTKVICPAPGVDSWRAEWERIEKWAVRSSVFKQHAHNSGVTHSSFSPDGLTLVTCGNDARVVVWRVKNNANLDLIWEDNFSRYNWSYCTTVQFNKSGSSFLVAGVLRTNIARTRKGEIIVVSAEDHDLGTIKSRIDTRPYDSEGCWFNNNYVISSDHDWLTHGVSVNKLWINKINFTEDSEPSLACMRQLYSLYNCAGASIRNLQVCNVPRQNRYVYRQYTGYSDTDTAVAGQLYLAQHQAHHLIPVPCTDRTAQLPEDVDNRTIRYYWDGRYIADYDENQSAVQDSERILIHYSPEYHQDRMQDHTEGTDDSADWLWEDESVSEEEDEYQWEYFTGSGQEEKDEIVLDLHINEQVLNEADKLLIFTTGHRTYLPHQLGVKLMSSVKFKQHLDINRDIQDFIREGNQRREDERQRLERGLNVPPYQDYGRVMHLFDTVDVLFDFQAYIVGYGISQDSRYVYVSIRPWPRNFHIQDIFDPPPAGIQTELVVLDIAQMKVVGRSTPEQRIFCLAESITQSPVQVTNQCVLTSAGHTGLIIDRHQGEEIGRLSQPDITVCTGNPHVTGQLVTGSEDGNIQLWSSKSALRSQL